MIKLYPTPQPGETITVRYVKRKKPPRQPIHLEGFRGRDKQWYLRQVGRNGRVLMTSEGYRRRAGVLGLVRLQKRMAPGIEFRWV